MLPDPSNLPLMLAAEIRAVLVWLPKLSTKERAELDLYLRAQTHPAALVVSALKSLALIIDPDHGQGTSTGAR